VSYRDRQRLPDIQAAINAIRSHLERGDLSDGLILDAIRIRLLESPLRNRTVDLLLTIYNGPTL
jgi:hypothetical protein